MNKVVITMTSWPGRIKEVGKAIYKFLKTQTVKPDYFYLWLSEEEFPNKEKDLPKDLLITCDFFKVQIKWCKYNEYCHKRWYVYPDHYNDCVISIDEDTIYDNNLVSFAKKLNDKKVYVIWNNLSNIISVNNEIKLNYKHFEGYSNKMKFSGQAIFPPKTFPLEAITKENIELRRKYCVKCDESWLQPFLIYNNIERSYSYKQKNIYNENDPNFKSTAVFFSYKSKLDKLNIHWKHFQMYIVLRLFPHLMKKWKELFPNYNDKNFKDKSIDELIKLLG